jgi:hypothetical protein
MSERDVSKAEPSFVNYAVIMYYYPRLKGAVPWPAIQGGARQITLCCTDP